MSALTWLKNGHHENCARYAEYGYDRDGVLQMWVGAFNPRPRCTCDQMRLAKP